MRLTPCLRALPRSGTMDFFPRKQPKRRIPGCAKVLLICSGKGGVGKSSVSVNLAAALSLVSGGRWEGLTSETSHQNEDKVEGGGEGGPAFNPANPHRLRVGILDLDIYGPSIPKLLKLENLGSPELTVNERLVPLRSHGLECMSMGFFTSSPDQSISWRGLMVQKAVNQLLFDVAWNDLDLLVIDSPPGTGDVLLTLGQSTEVDASIIVSTPQDIALIDVRKGVDTLRKLGIPLAGAVLNMSHFTAPDTGKDYSVFGSAKRFEATCKDLSLPVLARIPLDPDISDHADQGAPSALYAETVAGQAYAQLADKVKRQLKL